MRTMLTNWARTRRSSCCVCPARDVTDLIAALAYAREHHLTVIAHGAGHSYTDAALNTDGVVIDLAPMRHVLSWDPERGVAEVEPGVTMGDLVRTTLPDGWWPPVTPSTAEATIGGCVALNVNGKNAWKVGSFGEHVRSLTLLLASGALLTLTPQSHPHLFRAVVGGAGLLGVITRIELQLQRVASARVDLRIRPAGSVGEMLHILQHEEQAGFLEGWVDGLAPVRALGRGLVTCTMFRSGDRPARGTASLALSPGKGLALGTAYILGTIARPAATPGMRLVNRLAYCMGNAWDWERVLHPLLVKSTYYSPAVLEAVRAILPHGIETFQAFVPASQAEAVFKHILMCSSEQALAPLWCSVKRHRVDPFLLSYQVDGFSLEVNYHREPRAWPRLQRTLQDLVPVVLAAGGRFYLAKDGLLTGAWYRQSIGAAAVAAFLQIKQRYDPDGLFQSDLFRRVLAPV
jgi:FAD/FMN-containing dehydrogenase